MSKNELSGDVRGNVVQAGSVGQVIFGSDPVELPIPSQLPPVVRNLVSRQHELAALDDWVGDNPDQLLLAVINGAAGVGKTMLAVRWLHDSRDRFPDGQLYVDLGAFSQTGPVEPEDVLEWFLMALGLPAARVPNGLAPRVALYRSMTARRGMSILLDNAFSAAQVKALIPSSTRCTVLVTSRSRLTGLRLSGARFFDLDPLDVNGSVTLLKKLVGDGRADAELDEAEELARLCGGLPIALAVVGARLSARPHRQLRHEIAEIRQSDRLTALTIDEELSVSAVFDMSYKALPAKEARMYRLCALHPGAVFGVGAVAALAARSEPETESAIESLIERNLLMEVADRRFRYHDLLIIHARQLAERIDEEASRMTAVRRLVEWYLDRTVAADRALRPTRRRVGPRFQQPSVDPFANHGEALRWLYAERGNVTLAVQTAGQWSWPDLVWEFCEALWSFVPYVSDDWSGLYRSGVVAAHECRHTAAETRMRIFLGSILTNKRRYDEAIVETARALRLAEENSNRFSTATALVELASAYQGKGDLHAALGQLRRAREIREAIDTPRSVAQCQRQIGVLLTELGAYGDAIIELHQALQNLAEHDIEEARVLTALGIAHLRAGRLADAASPLDRAISIASELRSNLRRADALVALGELNLASADVEAARTHFSTARDLYASLGSPQADDLTERLARSGEQ